MIVINAIIEDLKIRPEKELTSEEQLTVTSSICNGVEYIYYQGDEPIVEDEEII
jgi:hypothetical protein